MRGVNNLRLLELYNFYEDIRLLVADFVYIFANCPGLNVLGLGLQCFEYQDHANLTFLEDLCVEYESKGAYPLRVDTLLLGHGMFEENCGWRFRNHVEHLSSLVQLQDLKNFHIYNGTIGDKEDSVPIPVDEYQLQDCKSIRQLSVCRLTKDVRIWLNIMADM